MPRRQEHKQFALNYAKRMLTNPRVKLSAVEFRRWFNLYCVLADLIKIDIKDEQPVQGKNVKDDLDTQAAEMLRRLGGEYVNTDTSTSTKDQLPGSD